MKNIKVDTIVKVGVFSAIAFILQWLGSMMPFKVGGFLEIEFSDLPAVILSFAMGPVAGVLVELIKNILHAPMTTTGFVGEFANFVINGTYVLVCGLIYRKIKTKKGAAIAMCAGVLSLVLTGFFVNLFILLPLYMPDAPFSVKMGIVTGTIIPFNFVKGIVQGIITMFIYKKISAILK